MIRFHELKVVTKSRAELIDITKSVEDFVKSIDVRSGICLVYSIHTTTAIIVNEHESGLIKDILDKVGKDFPREVGWLHNRVDDNAHAHLASSFIGSSRIFPIRDGRLVRGAWQNIFLLELDGPRNRTIILQALGE